MTQDNASFFEGTEKKVELVVDSSVPSLRGRGDAFWEAVVERSGAQILSRLDGPACEAYLLSESSLFVFDHKMIMITCGRTRLVAAVEALLEVVSPDNVRFFIYERKNEVFPHRQPTSFFDDVAELRRRLPGTAFRFGDEDEHHIYIYQLDRPFSGNADDLTLEILMHGIDPAVGAIFRGGDRAVVRQRSGLDRVLPGFAADDHLFEPGGYSLNAIDGDLYWTVHVTPQETGSYVSFETNYRERGELDDLVGRVLGIFRPRSFDLLFFDPQGEWRFDDPSYRLRDHVTQAMRCGYRVRFMNFYRPQTGPRQAIELTTV